MSKNETELQPKTISVPEAGKRYFDLSRGASYAAAASGEIPTIRIGRLLRVPVVALERLLEKAGERTGTPTISTRPEAGR
jgi:hypothetical protein